MPMRIGRHGLGRVATLFLIVNRLCHDREKRPATAIGRFAQADSRSGILRNRALGLSLRMWFRDQAQ